MAKKVYVNVNGFARNVKKIYANVNGVARNVTKGYVGVNGVARQFWGSEFVPPSELYYPNAPYPDPLTVFEYTSPFHLLQWGVNDYVLSVVDNTDDVFVVIYEANGTVAPYFFSDGNYGVVVPGGGTQSSRAYDHSGIERFYCFQQFGGYTIHPSYPLPYNTMDQLRDYYGWDTAYMKKHCTNVVVV